MSRKCLGSARFSAVRAPPRRSTAASSAPIRRSTWASSTKCSTSFGDDRGARVSRSPPTESPSPFISSEDAASGPYRSAKAQLVSMQVEDTDEIDVPGLHRRSSSARYELLRQRSQVVNQQYEGAKRQLQRLVSDSSMRSSDADEFTDRRAVAAASRRRARCPARRPRAR
jgi:hypothetical protein